MFSLEEMEYLKALVSTYHNQGYTSYLAHTVTDSEDTTDIVVFFSKESINALSNESYTVQQGLQLKIDSSQKSDISLNDRVIFLNSDYNGTVNVEPTEFCFTNAYIDYKAETFFVNPDIHYANSSIFCLQNTALIGFVLIIIFIYIFFNNIFRTRG